ncbi:MAG: efflux RND transporter permease subunit, partial [Candidatus Omnitrophota bacterium]
SIIISIRGGIPPTEVEMQVSRPIEEALATVSNLTELMSISKEGEATVVMSFKPGTDMNFAGLEVREKFAKVKNKLPKEIEKPVIANYNNNDYPCMILAFASKIYSPEGIRKVVEELVQEPLRRVLGVANVEIGGGRERKILIELDQTRLKAHGITMDTVLSAIGRNNLNLLLGDYKARDFKYIVRVLGEYQSVEEIKNMTVALTGGGSLIKLKDVAMVKDSFLEPTGFARMNERPIVSVYVQKESTGNAITVVEGLKKQVERVKPLLPSGIDMFTTYDQAEYIKKAIDTVNVAMLQGALLAILILLLFLTDIKRKLILPLFVYMGIVLFSPAKILLVIVVVTIVAIALFKNLRFVLIIAISIPISILVTFGCMYMMNLSRVVSVTLNTMTLTGLALGIGMLVDNSIVVLENIFTYYGRPMTPRDIAEKASEEMTLVIVAGTITTLVVFLPVLFVNEETKILYGGVALTVTLSLLSSLFVALSIVPLIASKMNQVAKTADWINGLYKVYRTWIVRALRYRYGLLLFALASFIGALCIFGTFDKEFIASTSQSDFTVFIRLPTGSRLEIADLASKKVEEVLRKTPEVETASSRVEPWMSKVYVKLVPSTKRKRPVKQIIDSIRQETDKIKIYFPQDENAQQPFIYFDEPQQAGSKELVIDIYGYDYKTLRELASSIASRMDTVKGLSDVKIRMREGRPELGLKVNKQKAASFGLSVNEVSLAVHGQMRGLRATFYHTKGREVEAIARLEEKFRKTFEDVRRLLIPNKQGNEVYLGQIVDFKYDLGPSEVWRKDKTRVIQVSANLGTISLGKAVADIKKAVKDIKFPENYFYKIGGNYQTLVESQKQFVPTIILTLLLIYMVLA